MRPPLRFTLVAFAHVFALACSAPSTDDASVDDLAPADARSDAALDEGSSDDIANGRDVPTDIPNVRVDARGDSTLGDSRIDAIAMDGRADVARADIALPGTCRQQLTALGIRYTVGPAARGIADPVTVTTPINGVRFFASSFTGNENPLLMDCQLGIALDALTRELRTHWNITAIVHYGIYNYRCIAGTDPCRLSQHAYALGIDLNSFRDTSNQRYSVTTDFVANGTPTCPPRASNPVDRVLKEIACWMYDSRTFNIILTPNYNAAHRDHFHVDLTSGSHFIGIEEPGGIDPMVVPGVPDLLFDDE